MVPFQMKTATKARSDDELIGTLAYGLRTAAGGSDGSGGGFLSSSPTTESLSSLLLSTMARRFVRELGASGASWFGAIGCFKVLPMVGGVLGARRRRSDAIRKRGQPTARGRWSSKWQNEFHLRSPSPNNKQTTTNQLTFCGCGERSERIRFLLFLEA